MPKLKIKKSIEEEEEEEEEEGEDETEAPGQGGGEEEEEEPHQRENVHRLTEVCRVALNKRQLKSSIHRICHHIDVEWSRPPAAPPSSSSSSSLGTLVQQQSAGVREDGRRTHHLFPSAFLDRFPDRKARILCLTCTQFSNASDVSFAVQLPEIPHADQFVNGRPCLFSVLPRTHFVGPHAPLVLYKVKEDDGVKTMFPNLKKASLGVQTTKDDRGRVITRTLSQDRTKCPLGYCTGKYRDKDKDRGLFHVDETTRNIVITNNTYYRKIKNEFQTLLNESGVDTDTSKAQLEFHPLKQSGAASSLSVEIEIFFILNSS